jgi:hypothetical protein
MRIAEKGCQMMTARKHRRGRTAVTGAFVLCLLAALAGCSGQHDASVSGRVTLGGEPLDRGTVTFHPEGNGPTAYAAIQPSGEYQLKTGAEEGIPSGEYRVTVVATTPPPKEGPERPGTMITPPQYADPNQSGFRFTIEPGRNQVDLELHGQ